MARTIQITFDAHDPRTLAGFWAELLGYVDDEPPADFATWDAALDAWGVPPERRGDRWAIHDPDGVGPRLYFQRVPEGKTAKNRLHLDVRAAPGLDGDERMAAFDARAAELTALGATILRREEGNEIDGGLIVMQDPEGNEFCLD